jgi:hypothetical protein
MWPEQKKQTSRVPCKSPTARSPGIAHGAQSLVEYGLIIGLLTNRHNDPFVLKQPLKVSENAPVTRGDFRLLPISDHRR